MKSSKSDNIFSNISSIKEYDTDLWASFENEAKRQEDHIELIASENYASKRILEAQGSLLTNKYAEGYPSKRYYGGCEFVDVAENLAIERAKQLFDADYANVQPHSGSSANAAAFLALLEPNDTILGMSLDHGGHLTHGSKVNFSGRNYKSVQYGLHPKTNDINYDEVLSLAKEHKPKLIIAGFSAFSGIVDWKKFREIADEVGAYFLVDLRSKNITGKDLEKVLGSVNITVNKNSVPNDTASPFITSGIRIGTPAITTRGFGKKEVVQVANWIADIIENIDDELVHEKVKNEVSSLTSEYPVYRL